MRNTYAVSEAKYLSSEKIFKIAHCTPRREALSSVLFISMFIKKLYIESKYDCHLYTFDNIK